MEDHEWRTVADWLDNYKTRFGVVAMLEVLSEKGTKIPIATVFNGLKAELP